MLEVKEDPLIVERVEGAVRVFHGRALLVLVPSRQTDHRNVIVGTNTTRPAGVFAVHS